MKPKLFHVLAVAIIALWFTSPFIVDYVTTHESTKNISISEFGDSYGAINALFSGLAFLVIYYNIRQTQESINSQTEQIRLQREELGLQREELKIQREERKEQMVIAEKQAILTSLDVAIENIKNLIIADTTFHLLMMNKGKQVPEEYFHSESFHRQMNFISIELSGLSDGSIDEVKEDFCRKHLGDEAIDEFLSEDHGKEILNNEFNRISSLASMHENYQRICTFASRSAIDYCKNERLGIDAIIEKLKGKPTS